MRRREFVALVGGAAAAWPLGAWSQQAMPVVGVLHSVSPEQEAEVITSLRKGLVESGYTEGRNVVLEFRWANNEAARLPELAASLVERRVNVIVALGGAVSTLAAKAATASIPIVFTGGEDPVAVGLVASFDRPGGNVTGINFMSADLAPKRLGLLKELVPRAARYAVMVNPNHPSTVSIVADLLAAVAPGGQQIEVFNARDSHEINVAFAAIARSGADALVVGSSSLYTSRRVQIVMMAAHHRLPAIYYDRRVAEAGGLSSYGANIADAVRQAGIYCGRILKGEKPSDLPVVRATKFEFVINLQTALTLGIFVSPTVLALADETIE